MNERDAAARARALWGDDTWLARDSRPTGKAGDTEWWVDSPSGSHTFDCDGRPTCHRTCQQRADEAAAA